MGDQPSTTDGVIPKTEREDVLQVRRAEVLVWSSGFPEKSESDSVQRFILLFISLDAFIKSFFNANHQNVYNSCFQVVEEYLSVQRSSINQQLKTETSENCKNVSVVILPGNRKMLMFDAASGSNCIRFVFIWFKD